MCTIYIVVIPHLALRNYVALLDLTCRCESAKHTPRGEGRYGLIYCSRRNSATRKSAAPPAFYTTRGIDALLPRQIPHGVISARHIISRISIRPSVCLSHRFSFSHFSARASACVHAHGDVRSETRGFLSPSPLVPLRGNTFLDHH